MILFHGKADINYDKTDLHSMEIKKSWYMFLIVIGLLLSSGCTMSTQDEDYKSLVVDAIEKLDSQNEKIIQPYQGMTADELSTMKTFAEQSKSAAEQMTLSDAYKKSREFFLRAMDATIEGVNIIQNDVDVSTQKVDSTAPATNAFIQAQSDLGSAADIIKVPKEKMY